MAALRDWRNDSSQGRKTGQRIPHEGRVPGDVPVVTLPMRFNTTEAGAVIAALQSMPRGSTCIPQRPLPAREIRPFPGDESAG